MWVFGWVVPTRYNGVTLVGLDAMATWADYAETIEERAGS